MVRIPGLLISFPYTGSPIEWKPNFACVNLGLKGNANASTVRSHCMAGICVLLGNNPPVRMERGWGAAPSAATFKLLQRSHLPWSLYLPTFLLQVKRPSDTKWTVMKRDW